MVAAATFRAAPPPSSTLARPAATAARSPLALLDDAVRAFRCQVIAQSMSHHSSSNGGSGSSSTRTASTGAPARGSTSAGGGGGHMAGSGSGGKGGRSVNTGGGLGGSMDEQDGDLFADEAEDDSCSWPADLPATLPPLLGAAPPSFSERPEAVIGKGGCATVYAWSAAPAGSQQQQQQQARWPAQATPATAAAVAALTSGCSVAVGTPLSGAPLSSPAAAATAPHLVIPSYSSAVCAPPTAAAPAPSSPGNAPAPADRSAAQVRATRQTFVPHASLLSPHLNGTQPTWPSPPPALKRTRRRGAGPMCRASGPSSATP